MKTSKIALVSLTFSLSIMAASVYQTSFAANDDCGACDGKWKLQRTKKVKPTAVSISDQDDNGGKISKTLSGQYGSYTARSKATTNTVLGLGVTCTNLRTHDGTLMKGGLGSLEDRISGWDAGAGDAPCNHGPTADALATVSGTGDVSCSISGNANNGLGLPAGITTTIAKAEISFVNNQGGWGAGQTYSSKVETSIVYTESGATGIDIGDITVGINGVTIADSKVDVNIDPTSKDVYTQISGTFACNCSKQHGPANIAGFKITGTGFAEAQGKVQSGAFSAEAEATSNILTCELVLDDGGTFLGCCNDQKPSHGGHDGDGRIADIVQD